MALNIEVKGDVAGLQAMATQLSTMSEAVLDSSMVTRRAGADSTHDWHGVSGDEFRSLATRFAEKTDDLGAQIADTSEAVRAYADGLAKVEDLMRQAREAALAGGLEVSATTIADPGAPPEAASPTVPLDITLMAAYARKVSAFQTAAGLVRQAGVIQNAIVNAIRAYLKNLGEKKWLNPMDLGTGIAGALLKPNNAWATRLATRRVILESTLKDLRNGISPSFGTRAFEHKLARSVAWQRGLTKTFRSGISIPTGIKWAKTINVPWVSQAVTAASTIVDISRGKPVTTSLASNFGGLAIAAVAVAFLPEGLIAAGVGFGVSSISSMVIENVMQ